MPKQRVVRHASAGESDEDNGAFWSAKQAYFGERRVFLGFTA
jgi:hypothetical protein